jgi:hypothetical protein
VLNVAFRLRPEQDERSLSGDHFEYFAKNPYANIVKALADRHFMPSRNGKLVKLNCGMAIKKIQLLCPEEAYFERDPAGSHTGLFGLYGSHTAVSELLRNCILEQISVSDFMPKL